MTMFQFISVYLRSNGVSPPVSRGMVYLAQVHQVDIRYFDHTFQPAPNNKYDYGSGRVRAEAGTLHIGHDFEDTTRANIFLEGKKELSIKSYHSHNDF